MKVAINGIDITSTFFLFRYHNTDRKIRQHFRSGKEYLLKAEGFSSAAIILSIKRLYVYDLVRRILTGTRWICADNSHYEKCGSTEENIDDIIPFELPNSWEWIRLSAILTSTDAGKSPQCENRPRTIGEWGVIKTTAIQDGYFLAEENKVLPPKFNLQESIVVHHGDLLITRAGPRNRTGVICVVDGEPENLILSDKTVRLSYLRNFVNPHYVMTALSSPAMQYFVIDAMTGMAASQVNISQEKMKTFLLPLPPLNEQQRIVDEVSKILGRIDKLNF